MRITGSPIASPGVAAPAATEVSSTDKPATVAAQPAAVALQSGALQPALAAMREMPEIDHAKVAALRDALAKGELPFNASRLAGLIERFHGGSR